MLWKTISELLARPFVAPAGAPPEVVRRRALLAIAIGLVLIAAAPITILIGHGAMLPEAQAQIAAGSRPGYAQMWPFLLGGLPFTLGLMLVQQFSYHLFGRIGTMVTGLLAAGFVMGCLLYYSRIMTNAQVEAAERMAEKARLDAEREMAELRRQEAQDEAAAEKQRETTPPARTKKRHR